MPNFAFTRDIPFATHNPSSDQPIMQTNTNSEDSIWTVDHFGFNDNDGGTHKQTRIHTQAAIPGGLIANQGTLYTKASGESTLFYTPGTSGLEYQMTRTSTANFALFGQFLPYGTPPAGFTQSGGWTFLPGNLIFQYGFYGKAGATGTSGTIQLPFTLTFPPLSIQMTLYRANANETAVLNSGTPPTTTAFSFKASSAGSDGIYWSAIGA